MKKNVLKKKEPKKRIIKKKKKNVIERDKMKKKKNLNKFQPKKKVLKKKKKKNENISTTLFRRTLSSPKSVEEENQGGHLIKEKKESLSTVKVISIINEEEEEEEKASTTTNPFLKYVEKKNNQEKVGEKKFAKKMKNFKPTFKIDIDLLLEKEPTEKYQDIIDSGGIEIKADIVIEMEKLRKKLNKETDLIEDYGIIRKLGRTNHGNIWKIKKYNGEFYTRKEIKYEEYEIKPKKISEEILHIFETSSHCEGIITLEDFFYHDNKIHLIYEYMNCREIESIIKTVGTFSERAISQCMFQLLNTLSFLHYDIGLIHRNIKPEEIYVNDLGQCKIFLDEKRLKMNLYDCFVPSPIYMCPERVRGEVHSFVSDCWSLGMIVCELALGKYPFENIYQNMNFFEVLGIIEKSVREKKILPRNKFSDEFLDFVNCSMKIDPHERWTSRRLLRHPFITKYSEDDVKPSFRSFIWKNYINVRIAKVNKKFGKKKSGKKKSGESHLTKKRRLEKNKGADERERTIYVIEDLFKSEYHEDIQFKKFIFSDSHNSVIYSSLLY